MSRRKTWREKLAFSNGLPKVVAITGKMSTRWGTGTCAIPAPAEIDALLRRGAEKARALAHPIVTEVKQIVGFVS